MSSEHHDAVRRLAYQTAAINFAARVDELALAAIRLTRSAEQFGGADAEDPTVLAMAEHARDVLAGVLGASPGVRAVFAAALDASQPATPNAPTAAPENT